MTSPRSLRPSAKRDLNRRVAPHDVFVGEDDAVRAVDNPAAGTASGEQRDDPRLYAVNDLRDSAADELSFVGGGRGASGYADRGAAMSTRTARSRASATGAGRSSGRRAWTPPGESTR